MVQITHNLKSPHVSHMCDMRITYVGFLDYMHMYMHAHACTHSMYTHTHVFTRVHACMANVCSQIAGQLFIFHLKLKRYCFGYSVFPYRALVAHQEVEDEILEEVESTSLILQLATSYLMEAFLIPKVTIYYTRCSAKSHH